MGVWSTGWIGAIGLINGDASWGCVTGVMGLIGGVAPWGAQHGLGQGDGIDSWGHATFAGSGQWDWFMGACHGPCDTGWIGAMGVIHRGAPWGRGTLAGSGRWVWLMGLATLAGPGYGINLWGCATLAGTGRWHWFMGMGHGDAELDRGDGIDLWGHDMGVRHWLDVGDGIELWGRSMGALDWIRVMELICGGEPWGHTTLTRSRWWDWFMWAPNGGAPHWLDRAMGLIHGDVPNDKVLYGCWIWKTIPCVLMSGIEVSARSVFG